MKVKKFLLNILNAELAPIRARRKEYEQDIAGVYDMLKAGCEAARAVAAETLDEVRRAMNDTAAPQRGKKGTKCRKF